MVQKSALKKRGQKEALETEYKSQKNPINENKGNKKPEKKQNEKSVEKKEVKKVESKKQLTKVPSEKQLKSSVSNVQKESLKKELIQQINEQETASSNHYTFSDSDDTDDEIITAKIGKVPFKWYENYKHHGYDADMKKIIKPAEKDKLDQLIEKAENPNWYKTIRDELNQQDVVLTDEQLFVIKRILAGKYASKRIAESDYTVEYEYNDPFPLDGRPLPKRKFMPSKHERMMVNKIVQGIQLGRITFDDDKDQEKEEELFDIWDNNDNEEDFTKRMNMAISAPKMKLPTHAESYNPPEEYIFDKKELKEWKDMDPEDRPTNFIPKKYENLRNVEFYDQLISERFERCLDLYLCPRMRKKKLDIDPESLIPKLPKPEELRPYPTTLQIQYIGHKSRVRSISCMKNGQYLASLDEKGEIIVWEVSTSRVMWRYEVEQTGYCCEFTNQGLLAVTSNTNLYIFNVKKILLKSQFEENEQALKESKLNNTIEYNQIFKWEYHNQQTEDSQSQKDDGLRIVIKMNDQIKSLSVHAHGDYIATVAPMAEKKNESVIVHSISKGLSSQPFNKMKGIVEKVHFHHKKPILFILTRRHCFVYNLQKQATVKKLLTGAQWNSCIDVHPYGDNLIIGTYDKKMLWFDLDLQTTPYKSLRYHEKAVRNVQYHKKYPLMASCSDDGSINILHAKVHTDMMENALILPVKMLKGHTIRNDLGVLDIQFHPTQPWIFSSGADHRIFLWT